MPPTVLPSLSRLPVLLVDCQTTGNRAGQSRIVEIGWQIFCAASPENGRVGQPRCRLLTLPDEQPLPGPVARLTGLKAEDFADAVAPARAWRELTDAAADLAAGAGLEHCPAVIHYARFERPFLKDLHANTSGDRPFPLEIVCTHEIVRRLLPDLPRKGLRAAAGYLGHSVPPLKRAADHLAATAFIWQTLVPRLKADHGIATLDDLRRWLAQTPVPRAGRRSFPLERATRLALPQSPGIYRFFRSNNDLLYVGKARSLKQRVNSYFRSRGGGEKNLEMLTQAARVEVVRTRTALEAALLECDAIQQQTPPYNIALAPGRRQVCFVSANGSSSAAAADTLHRLGPVPSARPFRAAHMLGCLLEETSTIDMRPPAGDILDLLAPGCSDETCLYEGLALFRQQYARQWRNRSPWQAFARIGRDAWKRRKEHGDQAHAAKADAEDGEVGDTPDPLALCDAEEDNCEAARPFEWTPETVAAGLESLLRHCGHLLRRSRWFALLSESSLAWPVEDEQSGRLRVLAVSRGVHAAGPDSPAGSLPPVPAGWRVPLYERRAAMDLRAYDRLRVLTTELRRLAAGGRTPLVRLGPETVLRQPAMERLLYWI